MASQKAKLKKPIWNSPKTYIYIAIVCLFLLLLFRQQDDLKNSIEAVKAANISLLGMSLVFSMCSFVAAAGVYWVIAVRSLPYLRTLLVQTATSFTNRLLPAGAGGLATFTRFLITQGHTKSQAVALVTTNNVLGFIGLILLTLFVALVSRTPLNKAIVQAIPFWVYAVVATIIMGFIVVLTINASLRKRTKKLFLTSLRDVRSIGARPYQLFCGLLFSMAITACFAAVLFVSIKAFGESVTILQTFIVLTVGVAAASITPTPGGIGGAEAGLVAGLSSIGINADVGLSIALVYRFATFWLPIIPGFLAFQIAVKKHIL